MATTISAGTNPYKLGSPPDFGTLYSGRALEFDGVTDYVGIADADSIDLGTSDFTLSLWIKTSAQGHMRIIDKKDASTGWLLSINTSEQLNYVLDDTGGDATYTGVSNISDGNWHYVVLSADRDGNGIIYIDAAVDSTDDISARSASLDSTSSIFIGADAPSGDSLFFDGIINEISLFKGVALSLAEVQELFNDGVALDATTHTQSSNLTGYWRNDGASTWTDRSANSNDGTVAGSPDKILLPEGTTSGKDILGFPLTHTNNGWLNLDGNEYVDVADNSVLAIVHDLTIECWFKTSVTGTNFGLVGKGGATDNTGYFLFIISNDKVRFAVDQSDGTPEQADSVSTLTDGNWHHVVGVYNSGTSVQLYIDNGSPVTETATIESSALDDAGSFRIGDTQDGLYRLDGSIDEARLCNRALSAGEISKNYKHGLSKHS